MDDHNNELNLDVKLLGVMPRKKSVFPPVIFAGIVFITFLTFSACQPAQKTIQSTPPATATQPTPTKATPSVDIEATSTAAQATQQIQTISATQTSVKADEAAAARRTATAIAPILKELPVYSVKTSIGHVASIYEPITLTVDGFHASDTSYDSSAITTTNFLMAADITWDSEYGIAGCGFSFRSDGNKDTPNEYRVILSRISGGRIYFYTLANGKIANFRNFYAIPYDRSFKWENGTTNRLAVGMKDNVIYIFSNQTWVGVLDITDPPPDQPILPEKPVKPIPPGDELTGKDKEEAQREYKAALEEYRKEYEKYKEEESKIYADYNAILTAYSSNNTVFDQGTVGLLAYSTSGLVNCQFSNAWLWYLE